MAAKRNLARLEATGGNSAETAWFSLSWGTRGACSSLAHGPPAPPAPHRTARRRRRRGQKPPPGRGFVGARSAEGARKPRGSSAGPTKAKEGRGGRHGAAARARAARRRAAPCRAWPRRMGAAMGRRNLTARAQGVRGRMYFLEGEPRKQHVGRRKLRVSYVAYGPTYTLFIFPRWA